jgi:hypothetical protein
MKLSALALDYDGTIAVNDAHYPAVREAIAGVRRRGVVVVLATGRQLTDLRRVAGDLACFDAIVAENGAVLHFPASGRHMMLAHAPHPAFLDELLTVLLSSCSTVVPGTLKSVITSYRFNSSASAPACSTMRENFSHAAPDVPLSDAMTGTATVRFTRAMCSAYSSGVSA